MAITTTRFFFFFSNDYYVNQCINQGTTLMDDEFARFFGAKDEAWLSDVHFWIADEKQKKKKTVGKKSRKSDTRWIC